MPNNRTVIMKCIVSGYIPIKVLFRDLKHSFVTMLNILTNGFIQLIVIVWPPSGYLNINARCSPSRNLKSKKQILTQPRILFMWVDHKGIGIIGIFRINCKEYLFVAFFGKMKMITTIYCELIKRSQLY